MAYPANWSICRLVGYMVDDDGNPATGYTVTVQSSQTRLQDNTSRRVIFPEPDVLTPSISDGYVWVDVVSDTDTDLSPSGRQHKITLKKGSAVVQTWYVTVDHAAATQLRFDNVTQAVVSSGGTQRDAVYFTSLQDFSDAPTVAGGGTVNLSNYFTKTETTSGINSAIASLKAEQDPFGQYATNDELTAATTPDASTSVKGKSRILGGTADDPTVPWGSVTSKPTIPSSKADVGLGNVDNTSDAAKPISTATQAAFDGLPFRAANVDQTGATAGQDYALRVLTDNPKTFKLQPVASGGGGTTLTQSASKTSAYTALANEIALIDTTGGGFTVTGPSSGAMFGARWKTGTALPTIAAPAGYTINGQASITMGLPPSSAQGEMVVWQAFGTDYQPVYGFKPQSALDIRQARPLNLARTRGSALVRQMAAAPPHAPLLMDTPPVVTQGTTVTSGLTASYGAERVRWTGPLSDAPSITGAMQPRGTTNGADGTQNWRAEAGEMWFDFDGRYLDVSLRANTSLRYRVWADGEAATADLVLLPSGTGANAFLKLDFGSARRNNARRITFEFEDTSTAISILALRAAPTDYLAPSPRGQRWLFVGDSQARGQGPTRWSFSYARTLGRALGIQDFWHIVSSSPGTGLVAGSAPVGPYGPRAQYDVIPYLRAGDVLVIQGSVNDFAQAGNVGPALEAYVNQIRAAVPDVGIVVTGLAYIGTPDTDRQTVNTELKTKAAALGLPFVDMFDPVVFGGSGREGGTTGDGPADWGRRSDYTHFTDDGAFSYGRRVASVMSGVTGVPAGDLKLNKATVGLGLVPNSAGGGGASVGDVMAALQPPIASGQYFFPVSATAITQNGTLGNGTMRVVPWLVTRPVSIARLAGEITTAGEAGSKLRLVLYADNGAGYPGALLVDAGQIAGDATGAQELTIPTQSLSTGLYWIGAVVQSAPTTQPFVRSVAAQSLPALVSAGATLPAGGTIQIGCAACSVSGAAPATFPTTVNPTSAAARVFCRVA